MKPDVLRAWNIRVGNFLFHTRNLVFPAIFFLLAAIMPPRPIFNDRQSDLIMDAVGLTVALAGQILRAVTVGLAYIKRGGKGKRIYADDLVQSGLFAHSRNPLYTGNILIMLGLALIHGSLLFIGLVVGACVYAYYCIVLAEEAYLRHKFGATYDDYCRRVNRFILSPAGLGRTLREYPFGWKKLIAKEYGTTFGWISIALLLMWWEVAATMGVREAKPRADELAVIWLIALLGWVTARILKKTGRLTVAG